MFGWHGLKLIGGKPFLAGVPWRNGSILHDLQYFWEGKSVAGGLKKLFGRFDKPRRSGYGCTPGLPPPDTGSQGFVSYSLKALNSTTVGTAIYILNCLCPKDSTIVLDVLHFDLNQPHYHKPRSRKYLPIPSRSDADVILSLQAYTKTLSRVDYSHIWLEIVHLWLLTCPLDEKFYQPDETGEDLFCQKLRSELIECILRLD